MYQNLDKIFCHFGQFFCPPPPPKNPENQNFEKMKKASGDVTILHTIPKITSCDVCFPRYGVRQTIFCHFVPFLALLQY